MNLLHFDICAMVLVTILFISNALNKSLHARTNTIFKVLLILVFLSSLSDLLAGYSENYFEPSVSNSVLINIFNYVYFISHINTTLVYFLYCFSTMGVWHLIKNHKFRMRVVWTCVLLSNILTLTNPIHGLLFKINDDMSYSRGPFIYAIYICTGIVSGFGLSLMIKFRKMIDFDKFLVLVSLVPINVIGIVIQMIFPTLLIEMFILATEMCVFVLVVHHQDGVYDPITGAAKYNSGVNSIKKAMRSKTPCSVILIKFINHKNNRIYMGQKVYNRFLNQITTTINSIKDKTNMHGQVYFLEYGLFAVMTEFPNKNTVSQFADKVYDTFTKLQTIDDYQVATVPKVLVVNCPDDICEYSTLLSVGTSFHRSLPDTEAPLYFKDYADKDFFIIKNELNDILKKACEEKTFEVFYQPIYSVEKKKFVSAEALIRLKHEKFGYISPGLFIPSAELTGDIHTIGNIVLDNVCRFLHENTPERYGIQNIHINLSASQCIEVDLVSKIKRHLDKYDISPDMLNFEITESAADIDPAIVDQNIQALYNHGINFSLDDYGIGYSNIKRVTGLPINIVKLDRSFIENYSEKNARIIIEDTISMLKSIGKKVLVEGIEDEDGAKHFTQLGVNYIQGCEYVQGFYFCKPLPATEFLEFIARHN